MRANARAHAGDKLHMRSAGSSRSQTFVNLCAYFVRGPRYLNLLVVLTDSLIHRYCSFRIQGVMGRAPVESEGDTEEIEISVLRISTINFGKIVGMEFQEKDTSAYSQQ